MDLRVSLDNGRLVLADIQTGQPLLTEAEAEWVAREAAEARAKAAEQELRQLRAQLRRQSGDL